jgi:hypothetical protein
MGSKSKSFESKLKNRIKSALDSYGFTDEELDFIINYRMGKDLNP